jgi:hypothetical protein
MQDTDTKRRFVEPTLTEEASLTDVTLTSGGKASHHSNSRHGYGHGNSGTHHSAGGPHGGGRKH